MDRFGNILFENQEIENERLELVDKEAHYFLGPNLTIKNCTLVLKVSARQLFFMGAHFIHCTFEVKQELKNHQQWIKTSLKGCRFKGRFSGCDFGHWPEYGSEPWFQFGSIEDCDFTEAAWMGAASWAVTRPPFVFPSGPASPFWTPSGGLAKSTASSGRGALAR